MTYRVACSLEVGDIDTDSACLGVCLSFGHSSGLLMRRIKNVGGGWGVLGSESQVWKRSLAEEVEGRWGFVL